VIAAIFGLAIVASLAFALVALLRRGHSKTLRNALTVRVVLSVLFFVLLLLGWWAGLIRPHGIAG
jgi:Protein of unknown function (DUF2909)